jgi:N-alpha-acetyltransferase 40
MHPKTAQRYTLSLTQAGKLSQLDLQACFDLVEETSRHDYEPSSVGWKPTRKMAEMKSAELRYILVKDARGSIRGFTSLMPTYEEGQPVVYCYEIHLKPEMQG